jgi:cleavage and polyadenylation specificity factor subunit 3
MPIFALGEAQNILLILEEYWSQNPDLQTIPIYYTSNLARKCMAVYQTYTNMMNERIRLAHRPFEFKYVRFLRQVDNFEDVGSCVMLATPGMLQSGGSRILLEKWASDQKNGLILAGYSVEGTMARVIYTLGYELMAAFDVRAN